MKLKYYLRGLGIGIAVTALVLSVSEKQTADVMTDEQIRARATELGMVERGLLSDILQDSTENQSQTEEESSGEEPISEEGSMEEITSEESVSEEKSGEKSAKEEVPSVESAN